MPAEVTELRGRHLAEVDRATPGLLAGLYLTGSVALGYFRRGFPPSAPNED